MMYTKLLSTGSYLPEKILTNADLEKMMDTTDEWIRTRTGIEKRHVAADGESSVDIAYQAALKAIENAGIKADSIDLVLVGTSTPEHLFPSNAAQLQARLGCANGPAMDISAACSGFIFALATADAYIRSGMAKRALVVGAEMMTSLVDWQDRNTAVLFGDGAGAVIIEGSDTAGIHGFVLHTDGAYKDLLLVPQCVGAPKDQFAKRAPYVEMRGPEVFKVAVRTLSALVGDLLEKCQMQASDIDFLVPHQANLRIIQATAKHLNLPTENVIVTVAEHANTSAASVPLALDFGVQSGKIKRGDKVLLEAFGGGFTWGGCILTY